MQEIFPKKFKTFFQTCNSFLATALLLHLHKFKKKLKKAKENYN